MSIQHCYLFKQNDFISISFKVNNDRGIFILGLFHLLQKGYFLKDINGVIDTISDILPEHDALLNCNKLDEIETIAESYLEKEENKKDIIEMGSMWISCILILFIKK